MKSPLWCRYPVWPWLSLAFLLVLRLAWLDAYTLNSDEAQHAHVAWAWSQGLLPYRDVFDNHGPLFGWLHAPLLRLLDGRADVLTWLRLAMQAWYVVALGAVGWMGWRLYGWRVAVVAVLVAGLYPRFFMVSGQFRTDDLWMALWLAALAFLVGAPVRAWRWLVAGLLVGCALCVSQKTLVLLVTALLAWATVRLMRPTSGRPFPWPYLGIGALGFLVVPAIFAGWLAWQGALGAAWYGLAGYNMGGVNKRHAAAHLLWFLLMTMALVGVLRYIVRRRGGQGFAWAAFLALHGGMYLLLIWFVWPLITGQDFLPAIPLVVLACCGQLASWSWLRDRRRWRGWLLASVLAVELATLIAYAPPWEDSLAAQRAELALVLHYTDRHDTVMDAKGDAIFRLRPYYPVLETLALHRLRRGQMTDTIVDELVNHRTMLVVLRRLPYASAYFVETNYVPAGRDVWVAGRMLASQAADQVVDVALPGDYVLTDGHGRLDASLDGAPVADHWTLGRGLHHFSVRDGAPVALVWSQAFDRGWRPLATGGG
ncbi:glycosyltransferase family 39 protein [Dyella soli]|uniref:Glycosyltransferase RgtA/B/C/D-like domain-containing protein n=1 Tax=Dyella soli TaxID=522319 RepID=A0A4R0YWL6_9GAMM|nr:glycosyltransferase family 39 protein [Dyella soli]TCI09874.1 hypothetical protein EZM97_13065 [Dyella soli]